MIEKLLMNVFKKQLGSQYEFWDNDNFERRYTHVAQLYGNQMSQINYDTFEKHGNKIIAVVSIMPAQYAVTSFCSLNTTYTLSLWVPVNYNMINSNGEYLVEPKFNVDKDLQELRKALINKTIDFGDGYKGEITFSEPSSSGGYDNSGSYKRKVITISGKINFTTKGYYGRDYKIQIGKENENGVVDYYTIDDINSFNFTPQSSPIENHQQGDIVPEEDVEAIKQACVFMIDDSSQDEELNELFTKLALSGEMSKGIYMLRVSKRVKDNFVNYAEYPVYLNVNLSYQFGNSDVGTFTISCMRCK